MTFRYWLLATIMLSIMSLPSLARNASRPLAGPTPTQQAPAWVTGNYRPVNYYRPPQLVRQSHRKPVRRTNDTKKNRRVWPGD